eukprot:Awhi_evm1s10193
MKILLFNVDIAKLRPEMEGLTFSVHDGRMVKDKAKLKTFTMEKNMAGLKVAHFIATKKKPVF